MGCFGREAVIVEYAKIWYSISNMVEPDENKEQNGPESSTPESVETEAASKAMSVEDIQENIRHFSERIVAGEPVAHGEVPFHREYFFSSPLIESDLTSFGAGTDTQDQILWKDLKRTGAAQGRKAAVWSLGEQTEWDTYLTAAAKEYGFITGSGKNPLARDKDKALEILKMVAGGQVTRDEIDAEVSGYVQNPVKKKNPPAQPVDPDLEIAQPIEDPGDDSDKNPPAAIDVDPDEIPDLQPSSVQPQSPDTSIPVGTGTGTTVNIYNGTNGMGEGGSKSKAEKKKRKKEKKRRKKAEADLAAANAAAAEALQEVQRVGAETIEEQRRQMQEMIDQIREDNEKAERERDAERAREAESRNNRHSSALDSEHERVVLAALRDKAARVFGDAESFSVNDQDHIVVVFFPGNRPEMREGDDDWPYKKPVNYMTVYTNSISK